MDTEKLATAPPAHWARSAREQPCVRAGTLLIGLGSHYGDDCAGWCVACAVAAALQKTPAAACRRAVVRLARQPLEILDWCSECARLLIVDACLPGQHGDADLLPSHGAWERWKWPHVPALRLRPATSHDFGLQQTLALGSQLGMLPAEVEIWGLYIAPHSVRAGWEPSGHAQPRATDALAVTSTMPRGICPEGWTSSGDCGDGATLRPRDSGRSSNGVEMCGRHAHLACNLSPNVRAAIPKIVDALIRSLAGQAFTE